MTDNVQRGRVDSGVDQGAGHPRPIRPGRGGKAHRKRASTDEDAAGRDAGAREPAAPSTRSLSRRSAIGVGGGALGAAVLGACGGSSDGSDGNAGDVPAPKSGEPIAKLADVPVGGAASAKVGEDEVVLSQPEKGMVMAFSAACTHQGCTVKPEGAELHCPCHGSVFDAATGEVLDGPAPDPLPKVSVELDGDQIVAS